MSTYTRQTRHPKTKKWEEATWYDDLFGRHNYGVVFPSDAKEVELEKYDLTPKWSEVAKTIAFDIREYELATRDMNTKDTEEKSECCGAVASSHHLARECSSCGKPFVARKDENKAKPKVWAKVWAGAVGSSEKNVPQEYLMTSRSNPLHLNMPIPDKKEKCQSCLLGFSKEDMRGDCTCSDKDVEEETPFDIKSHDLKCASSSSSECICSSQPLKWQEEEREAFDFWYKNKQEMNPYIMRDYFISRMEQRIEEARKEGYEKGEIMEIRMRGEVWEQGVKAERQRINNDIEDVVNENMMAFYLPNDLKDIKNPLPEVIGARSFNAGMKLIFKHLQD